MRISDWSSDVCSSDLSRRRVGIVGLDAASRGRRHAGNLTRNSLVENVASPKGNAQSVARSSPCHGCIQKAERLLTDIVVGFKIISIVISFGHIEQQSRVPHMNSVSSEEHKSELHSLMRNSYAVFCLT